MWREMVEWPIVNKRVPEMHTSCSYALSMCSQFEVTGHKGKEQFAYLYLKSVPFSKLSVLFMFCFTYLPRWYYRNSLYTHVKCSMWGRQHSRVITANYAFKHRKPTWSIPCDCMNYITGLPIPTFTTYA